MFNKFWKWYEKNLETNTAIASFLFALQLVHLYWLTAHVVASKYFGQSFFELSGIWEVLITLVDYTEIPALIAVSLIYINDLRRGKNTKKSLLYLLFLNSQWLHIFWITDEYVLDYLLGDSVVGIP